MKTYTKLFYCCFFWIFSIEIYAQNIEKISKKDIDSLIENTEKNIISNSYIMRSDLDMIILEGDFGYTI